MLNAEWNPIKLSASVPMGYREILKTSVLKSVVELIPIARSMKNVIVVHHRSHKPESAKGFAYEILALLAHPALLKTIERYVPVTHHLLAMATLNVNNVSIHDFKCFNKIVFSNIKNIKFTIIRFILLLLIAPVERPEPECRVDQDCPSQTACIAERCQNPCRVANPCTGSQQCLVTDTLPTRTVACVCPQGFVSGSNGECKQGKETRNDLI